MLRIAPIFAALLLALTLAPATAQASLFQTVLPQHVHGVAKVKKVNINFLNTTNVARAIKVEEQIYSIAPHQKITISVPVGSKVLAGDSGESYKTGDVLLTVTRDLQDATISLK